MTQDEQSKSADFGVPKPNEVLKLTEEWVTDIIRKNTGGVGEIYPEPAIEIIVKRHKEIVAKLKQELADVKKRAEQSCMTIAQHEKLMEECRNYYEKNSIPKARLQEAFYWYEKYIDESTEDGAWKCQTQSALYRFKSKLLKSGKEIPEDGWCVKCKKGIESGKTICEECKGKEKQ